MKRKELFLSVLGIFLVLGMILGTSNSEKPIEKIGYLMDTQIRIAVYDKNADRQILEDAYNEMLKLDKLLSNFCEESETNKLNTLREYKPSAELYNIILKGMEVSLKTNGAFDLTVYPLSELWNYKNAYVPSKEEIDKAKNKVAYNNIILNDGTVTLLNDAEIDVSSIAKGYIADHVIEFLKIKGIEHALVDAGGNIKVIGSPSGKASDGFAIGIQDPAKNIGLPLGQIGIYDESVVTSGVYERNFEKDGKFYHHIINPETGYPSESDVKSISVICKESAMADAYATAVVVMGSQKGVELINSIENMECIIIRNDNKIVLSDGMDNFVLTCEDYTLMEE